MYHSITIENLDNAGTAPHNGRKPPFNTYDWHLIPERRPSIKAPEVKKQYVDIPGANGALDYTESLNGILYNNRKGSWTFYVENTYQNKNESAWNVLYSDIMNSINGVYFDHIWLEDDIRDYDGKPDWYYKGRIFFNEWRSDPQFSKVVLDYELDPYKYPTPYGSSVIDDWLWNDLFSGKSVSPITYGNFNVDGSKARTIKGGPYVSAFCSQAMSVKLPDGTTVPIPANEATTFTLPSSDITRVTFYGNGNVNLYYERGPEL